MITLLACASPPIDGPPDVVIVTVDTLRADRLGFAGHGSTPTFDALAAAGTVFDEATTPFPRTTPALGSLHTGLLPLHHGSREVGDPVDADGRLAGWLRDAGWQTVALSAMSVAGPEQRMDGGFDNFVLDHDVRAGALTAQALAAVGGLDRDRPALLWVHYADPHFPYLPEAPIDAPRCRALGQRAEAGKLGRASLFSNRDGEAARVLEECRALYDGEVAAVDHAVGELLAGLAARGRPQIVVLTADHGENQGENGLFFEHGPDLHDASVRVPLVMSGPGVPVGRDAAVARLEDVAPTVLALLGLAVPAPGVDGVPLFGGPRDGVALIESGSALHAPLFRYLVSGRGDRWCLNEGPLSWCTLRGRTGLFDHAADPELKADLATAHPDAAERLRLAALRWPPESAHLRLARAPDGALLSVPTVDGWTRTGADRLARALDGFEAALRAADGPVAGDEGALRSLGYVE